jgi:uncharacterized phage-associated protein
MYSEEHIEKIGNTIIFLASNTVNTSKTKLLKLLYILDEISIKQSGLPFLNLKYKVWKFGPVANDIFVELSTSPSMLKNFIEKKGEGEYILPKKAFSDDEFTQKELELLNFVVGKFGGANAAELIAHTHRKNSPWYNAAVKNSVLDLLESEKISTTEIVINMSELIEHDERKKRLYFDYIEHHSHY